MLFPFFPPSLNVLFIFRLPKPRCGLHFCGCTNAMSAAACLMLLSLEVWCPSHRPKPAWLQLPGIPFISSAGTSAAALPLLWSQTIRLALGPRAQVVASPNKDLSHRPGESLGFTSLLSIHTWPDSQHPHVCKHSSNWQFHFSCVGVLCDKGHVGDGVFTSYSVHSKHL